MQLSTNTNKIISQLKETCITHIKFTTEHVKWSVCVQLRTEIIILRFHRVMKNISLV